MRRAVALLAVVLVAVASGCNDDAEPGAPREATLVLDFQPNAVHAGIYSALRRGYYEDEGVDLEVREPSASTDAPKLLEAGRAEFAILDIHDLALARERGLDVVGIAPIVQRPLASVIATTEIDRPRDLVGRTVGVTGLPSDDAVLDSVLEADGADPDSVDRVTIGFNAVAALAAGRVDAATAFWNAEWLELRRQGVAVRAPFRVDDYGAPSYPELVLVASRELLEGEPELARSVAKATTRGYRFAISNYRTGSGSGTSVSDLLAGTSGLDREDQRSQFDALMMGQAFYPPGKFDPDVLRAWARWDAEHGIVESAPVIDDAFALDVR